MNELALFAGAGGGILGGQLLGWRTVCAVESDPYCCDVLAQRQDDGCLDPFPIWRGDIRDFDGRPWAGTVDVVSGGFPCTDIAPPGGGAGINGDESGLWKEMARITGEVRPRFVFVENSPMLTARGLGTVLGDLASLGFDAEWGVVGAHHISAPHKRDRIWIVATSASQGKRKSPNLGTMVHQTAPWVPCPGCENYWCGIHKMHAHDCDCPAVEEWDTSPYSTGGALNPMWVEWLMGWPIGWTDLKPLGTDKFQQWLRSHGKSWPRGSMTE